MNDNPTLVRFSDGYEEIGVGKDGLPLYRPQLMIQLDRPPYLSLHRVATDVEIEEYDSAYQLYLKETKGRTSLSLEEGYPLALWPAMREHELRMCAARDINTVEQLAKLVKRKAHDMPSEIIELAKRAQTLLELQGELGKFEDVVKTKDGIIEALKEQLDEAQKKIAADKALIDTLKNRVA